MSASSVYLIRSLLLTASVLAAAACAKSVTSPSPIDSQFTLSPGQSATVTGAGVRVRFDGVTGDARCPADAFCIQGGDAIVRVTVESNTDTSGYDLHTGSMAPVQHADLTLAIVRLEPYPFGSQAIEPGDYRLTLRVTR